MPNDNGPDNSPDERQDEITEEGPLTCNVFLRGLVRSQPDLAVIQEIRKERSTSESPIASERILWEECIWPS